MNLDDCAVSILVGHDGRTEMRTAKGINLVPLGGVLRSIADRLDPRGESTTKMIGTEMSGEEEAAGIRDASDMVRRLEASTGAERVQQALTRVLSSHRASGNQNFLTCTCGTFEDIIVDAADEDAMLAAAELLEIHQSRAATMYILADIDSYARAKGLAIDVTPNTRPDGSPL